LTNRNRIEAAIWGKRAKVLEVRYLYGTFGRICGGHKREGKSALPGEVCHLKKKGWQKSAEAIVGTSTMPKG
jgi:hypothetical protein